MSFKHRNGLLARDRVTGLEGIIRYRVEYLTGCKQYGLQPKLDKDGKLPDAVQFDENAIEIIGDGIVMDESGDLIDITDFSDKKKRKLLEGVGEIGVGGPQRTARRRD